MNTEIPFRDRIRIGLAGWSYADWKEVLYPARSAASHELELVSAYFDTIEINNSFYRPIRPEIARVWLRKVAANPRFRFTAKLNRRFTHERDAGPAEEREFKEGMLPLMEAGRLGALLLQFPWSFKNFPEQREYLKSLLVRFQGYPLVVEMRHASWNSAEALDFLEERGAGFCNIDQPLIGRSMPATENVTNRVGYVRLHGRNYQTWFAESSSVDVRYDYIYAREELMEWKPRIEAIAKRSDSTYVILNNHYLAKAAVNALELTSIITNEMVRIPPLLLQHYPHLEAYSRDSPQPRLFRAG